MFAGAEELRFISPMKLTFTDVGLEFTTEEAESATEISKL